MNIKRIVFYLLCVLLPFENTALASIGGVFTAPLGIILVPVMLLLILTDIRKLPAFDLNVIKFFFLTLGLSFVSLLFFLDHCKLTWSGYVCQCGSPKPDDNDTIQ